MKKIIPILLAFTSVITVGCVEKTDVEIEQENRFKGFNIIVIDSCEYLAKTVQHPYGGEGYLAHKGNCRFCKERRQKEMKEIVEELKGK